MDKIRARGLASQLMFQHGLYRWTCEIKDLKSRYGQCEYHRHVIALSEYYVLHNEEWKIKDTILHEIAHALVGHEHGHDKVWQAKAREIGAIPKACSKVAKMPIGRYQALCPACKKFFHMQRKPIKNRRHWCPKCGPDRGPLKFILACAVAT